jgi:putative sigma-54 modulation protein
MRISYTGKQAELSPVHRKKLDARFLKLSKILDGKEEKGAHVILSTERRTQRAEVTVHYYGHPLVAIGASTDLFTAINSALDKLEKQLLKERTKWRDTKRTPEGKLSQAVAAGEETPLAAEAEAEPAAGPQIFHVNHHEKRKPITLDEAILEMEGGRDYLVYRDAETNRVSMLVRRRDGHLDLIET